MEYETSSEDLDVLIFDIDGQHSDPITPRTPKEMERLQKIREKYIKAGLIEDKSPKSPESKTEAE